MRRCRQVPSALGRAGGRHVRLASDDDDLADTRIVLSNMMQRRTGKNAAYIAPPTPSIPTSEVTPGLDAKPPSRLGQRTFGLPNRIWLILALFGSLLLFTRFVLPAHTSDAASYYLRNHSPAYASTLKPHNYLNASADAGANPFAFCPTFGDGDELAEKYGALTISQSWLHLGSGARVQKVFHKAFLGQPVTISVIGGSSAYSILSAHSRF